MGERRAAWWILGVGAGAFALVAAAGMLWWKLPVWQPEWVMRHSPFVEPVLRADGRESNLDYLVRDRMWKWGASATPALLRYASNPKQLHAALYWLSQVGDDRALPIALAHFSSSDDIASGWALTILTRLDPADTVRRLPAEVRRRLPTYSSFWRHACDDSIAEMVNPVLLPESLLLETARSNDGESRNIKSLEVLLPRVDPSVLGDTLNTADDDQRLAILYRLSDLTRGWVDGASEIPWADIATGFPSALLRAAQDQNEEVRSAAFPLLSKLGQLAVPTLGRGLLAPDWYIRKVATEQLARLADPACLPYVIRAIAEHPEEPPDFARLVAKIRDPDADLFLLALLKNQSFWVREVAIGAFADGRPGAPTRRSRG